MPALGLGLGLGMHGGAIVDEIPPPVSGGTPITDEAGNAITDEAGNPITD